MIKNICIVRSNSMRNDSRIEKELRTFIKNGFNVLGIGWDRNLEENDTFLKNIYNNEVNIIEVKIKSEFGGGFKKNIFPLIKFQKQLYKLLKTNKDKIDVVHACDFDTAFTCLIFCKKYKKKLVYDIFDFYVDAFNVPKIIKPLIKALDFSIIKKADATIICTEERKKQIEGSKPKKLYVIHNSPYEIENNLCSQMFSFENKIKICYFGILNDGRLIKELVNIIANSNNLELHIGGFGKYENYIENIAQKRTNILYYGKLEYRRVLELESNCDIITALYDPKIPNHKYAAPNKFYEAIMLGKPLIMCSNTGMSDVVKNNNLGIVINNFTKDDLKDGIDTLISIKNEWENMGNRGKELYKNLYSWKMSEKELLKLYKNL